MAPVDEQPEIVEWREGPGRMLQEARERRRLSKRTAARTAGFAEITWRQLETGARQVAKGIVVPVSPRSDTLEAAARAVGLSPADLFAAAGRSYTPSFMDDDEIQISASGVDLDELAREDPEQYESIMDLARIALDRARARRRS